MPGHLEGDLLVGSNNSYIASLVERHTRYVMLAKVTGSNTETVINALVRQAHKLPGELYKSLTWDRGKEMANHQRFTLATDIKVYFCDPQSPWQRGSIKVEFLAQEYQADTYSKGGLTIFPATWLAPKSPPLDRLLSFISHPP